MTIGLFEENHSEKLVFADTNKQISLIASWSYNHQYKSFCYWLTLIERRRHPSKVSVFYHQLCKRLCFDTNVIYVLSRVIVKQRGFFAISAITADD